LNQETLSGFDWAWSRLAGGVPTSGYLDVDVHMTSGTKTYNIDKRSYASPEKENLKKQLLGSNFAISYRMNAQRQPATQSSNHARQVLNSP
jgi:hypothetical protein